ncbi:endonuclease/exonuclease/phosphatase family protein [Neptunomonas qingdaonensis]|uniref:Uncharacterized conserved protein YafD, endonuclease/exonuclease/phosphatase (EEP) superfamily n=1 Tax=Neptunomonas qingdaonensis TaxID=1045558 RepID=A0A1I2SIJ1_9GAMM|nr:endonuclease/exonuclease/phosphatase family protein [Neptunomonas qingdaonensis]SFG52530.1 Uncharacterized conserved protein YafD, endonuclease/exonuclease/phosphatase (EEP) superfamily [Neptunomonas qingdaonensis]
MIKSRFNPIEKLKIMGSASEPAMGPEIDVLIWNVYKCKKKGWQEDFIRLCHDKDLILLQETIVNSPFDAHFEKSSKYQWIMARSFRDLRTNFETGIKTGSTVAAKTKVVMASLHSEPLSKTKKMLLTTIYPLNRRNDSLLVINAHMINFVSFIKFKAHLDTVSEVLEHHVGPVILAGDFNTWNWKRLRYFHEFALSFSLIEVDLVRKPKMAHLFQHLDHIYCKGFDILNAKVLTNIRSSDHYPLQLTLRFTK